MYSRLLVTRQQFNWWELQKDWSTPYGIVPKGFKTNGASIPRVFWWFMHPAGVLFEAATMHDYMYEKALKTKLQADNVFREIALDHGVSEVKVTIAYYLVRLFGRGNYG